MTTTKTAAASPATSPEDMMALAGAWGETARETYETAFKSFSENAEKFRAEAEESFTTARAGFEAASERLRTVSADTLVHARTEMTQAVDFANELARAKSVADALEIQRGYWTKLFETRAAQMKRATEATAAGSSATAAEDRLDPSRADHLARPPAGLALSLLRARTRRTHPRRSASR